MLHNVEDDGLAFPLKERLHSRVFFYENVLWDIISQRFSFFFWAELVNRTPFSHIHLLISMRSSKLPVFPSQFLEIFELVMCMLICDVMEAYFKGEVGDVEGGRVGMSGHQVVQFATFFNTWDRFPLWDLFSTLFNILWKKKLLN